MSTETAQTFEQAVNAFYPDAESEPLEVPTEEAAEDETPVDELDNSNDEAEESSEDEKLEADNTNEDGDILVYEINNKEYTAKDIEKLEVKGKELQAGYTKKYQALAEDSKKLEDAINNTNDLAAQLEVLIGEDEEINWSELKEDDPDRYIELSERAQARKEKLKEVKANNATTSNVDVEAERSKLVKANPQWLKDGEVTDDYKSDMDALGDFYAKEGWTQEQVDIVNSSAAIAQLVIDTVRAKAGKDSKPKAKAKKVIATPKAGKNSSTTSKRSAEEIFYGTK